MSIKRAFAVPADNFTIVSNEWLRDGQISLKARGLLALLASHRIGWEVTIDTLVRENPEGRDAIRGAVAELEEAGYLVRDMRVGGGGKFAGVDYSLVDPRISRVGKPDVGLSDVGEPATKKTISSEDHLEEDHAPASRSPRTPKPRFAYPEAFETFWSTYPLRKEKRKAYEAWAKATAEVGEGTVLQGAKAYAHDSKRLSEPRFTKHPTTWLNQCCWDDDYTETRKEKAWNPWS